MAPVAWAPTSCLSHPCTHVRQGPQGRPWLGPVPPWVSLGSSHWRARAQLGQLDTSKPGQGIKQLSLWQHLSYTSQARLPIPLARTGNPSQGLLHCSRLLLPRATVAGSHIPFSPDSCKGPSSHSTSRGPCPSPATTPPGSPSSLLSPKAREAVEEPGPPLPHPGEAKQQTPPAPSGAFISRSEKQGQAPLPEPGRHNTKTGDGAGEAQEMALSNVCTWSLVCSWLGQGRPAGGGGTESLGEQAAGQWPRDGTDGGNKY